MQCHNRRGVHDVIYGDHRAADSYGAVLLQHAREHIQFPRFRHYNSSAGQSISHPYSSQRNRRDQNHL
jgi:hypothetical protein